MCSFYGSKQGSGSATRVDHEPVQFLSNKVKTGMKPHEVALFTPSQAAPQAPLRQDHTTIFGSGKARGFQS